MNDIEKSNLEKMNKAIALCPLYNFVVKGDYIYCSSWKYNAAFIFNIKTGEIEHRNKFEKYNSNEFMLFRVASFENIIIAIPYTANNFIIQNTQTNKMFEIELPSHFLEGIIRKFNTYVEYKNKIYFFPGDINGIYRLDMQKMSIDFVLNVNDLLKKKYNYDKHVFFANGNYMNEDKVYLGCWGTNRIIIFHMDNYDMDLICIDEENAEILSICGKENALFILLKGGKVVIMDINTFEKIVLDVNKENKSEIWGNSEGRMGVYLDYLYVFPDDMEFTKKINISNGHTEKVFDDEVMRSMRGNYEQIKFLFGTFDHGIVYWYSNIGDIYWCDVENSKDIKHIHLKYNPDEIQQWLQANMHTEKTMFEDKYLCTLSTLCHHVIGNDEITSNYDNSKNVGNIIYTNI